MYTENLSQQLSFGAGVAPQVLTSNASFTSDSIDLSKSRRALFAVRTGTFGGTSPTLSAAITLQVSPDNSTWTNSTIVTGVPALTAQNATALVEVRSDQLTQQSNNMRYARLSLICTVGGTSPTIPIDVLSIGGSAVQKPNSQNNVSGVVSITTAP
jgi:hypothetical protein